MENGKIPVIHSLCPAVKSAGTIDDVGCVAVQVGCQWQRSQMCWGAVREGSQALHVAVGKYSACYKALLHLALCWVLTMMFSCFHLFLLVCGSLISACIWLSFQKQTKNKPSGSLFSLYQAYACWFDIFLWKQYIIFDTSTTSCCLGEICCASFYHWKLSFPPCSGGNFLLKAFFNVLHFSQSSLSSVLTAFDFIQKHVAISVAFALWPTYSFLYWSLLAYCLLLHHFKCYSISLWRSPFPLDLPFLLPRRQEADSFINIS